MNIQYRRFTDDDLLPWTGGDELENREVGLNGSKSHTSIRPKIFLIQTKKEARYHLQNVTGHQTGTKSRWLYYKGSHGWRGRKARRPWKD